MAEAKVEEIIPPRRFIKVKKHLDYGPVYAAVKKRPEDGWSSMFSLADEELRDISLVVKEKESEPGARIFPKYENIFRAFSYVPPEEIKVVILGQDPYHGLTNILDVSGEMLCQAQGMSFSLPRGASYQSSLGNIYKVLEKTVEGWKNPGHGDLTDWAKQGVLLLNTELTVTGGKAGSHKGIWTGFIARVIDELGSRRKKPIYLLWGKFAQQYRSKLPEGTIYLETSHPSGFSASRGFLDCNHFNEVNKILKERGDTPIDWTIKP